MMTVNPGILHLARLAMARARLCVICATTLTALLALGLPSGVDGHWVRPTYTYDKTCDDGHGVDPINVVFRGSRATFSRVRNHIAFHFWGNPTSGSRQYIRDHGFCRIDQAQSADAGRRRYHIRLWQTIHTDDSGRIVSVGDAHHETFTSHGHVVDGYEDRHDARGPASGFNEGRREMERDMRRRKIGGRGGTYTETRRHRISHHDWGNAVPFQQRDGKWAASNGDVVLISMGSL